RVYAVRKSSIASLFNEDLNSLRDPRLFEATENDAAEVQLKGSGKTLELKKTDETWQFVTPAWGLADPGGAAPPPPSKFAVVPPPPQKETSGVKAFLKAALLTVDLANFVDIKDVKDTALKDYGLTEDKATLRVQLTYYTTKRDPAGKETKTRFDEVLLIGN